MFSAGLFVVRAPHNDYSPAVLQTINDSLYLNIFDECFTDISQVGQCFFHKIVNVLKYLKY